MWLNKIQGKKDKYLDYIRKWEPELIWLNIFQSSYETKTRKSFLSTKSFQEG